MCVGIQLRGQPRLDPKHRLDPEHENAYARTLSRIACEMPVGVLLFAWSCMGETSNQLPNPGILT